MQMQICKRNLSKQKSIFGVEKKGRHTKSILDRAVLLLLTRHGNHNQTEARNRVVASGRRLLSKSGQQLMTGTAFKYVIAPTNVRVLPARLLSLSLSNSAHRGFDDLFPSPAPLAFTCKVHPAFADTNLIN